MSKFQVGDKVWNFIYGSGEVICTNHKHDANYPIEVFFKTSKELCTFMTDGKSHPDYVSPTLYHEGVEIIENDTERVSSFEDGTIVLVRDDEKAKKNNKFYKGDIVWSPLYGLGKITYIICNKLRPIDVMFFGRKTNEEKRFNFRIDGRLRTTHIAPLLYRYGVRILEHLPDRSSKLKKGQPVLVRNFDWDMWEIEVFNDMTIRPSINKTFHQCSKRIWRYCIPYEGNEHLLGTSDNINN